jgi:RNA polymerase sigma-70 factor (ECF subfamily)
MGDEERERPMHAVATTPHESRPATDWLEPIYRENSRAVLRVAYRITGNAADAEDVLHTVFLRLARRDEALDTSLGPAAVGSYLRRAATNAALDMVSSRHARSSAPLDDAGPREAPDPGATPEGRHFGRELEAALRAALSRLNRRAAQMFALRYFEDLDNGQIASLFDTTPGTVAVTLHRARARLLDELSPLMGGAS